VTLRIHIICGIKEKEICDKRSILKQCIELFLYVIFPKKSRYLSKYSGQITTIPMWVHARWLHHFLIVVIIDIIINIEEFVVISNLQLQNFSFSWSFLLDCSNFYWVLLLFWKYEDTREPFLENTQAMNGTYST